MIRRELPTDCDGLVEVEVDRPPGSVYPEDSDLIYELNCGFVRGLSGKEGRGQEAYIVGVCDAVLAFRGVVIAVVRRNGGREEILVVAPEGMRFSKQQVIEQIRFQERFFDSEVELI